MLWGIDALIKELKKNGSLSAKDASILKDAIDTYGVNYHIANILTWIQL